MFTAALLIIAKEEQLKGSWTDNERRKKERNHKENMLCDPIYMKSTKYRYWEYVSG